MRTNTAVAWFGKYTLAGEVVAKGSGWMEISIQHVSQNGEPIPGHHLVGTTRSFSAKDVLVSD